MSQAHYGDKDGKQLKATIVCKFKIVTRFTKFSTSTIIQEFYWIQLTGKKWLNAFKKSDFREKKHVDKWS